MEMKIKASDKDKLLSVLNEKCTLHLSDFSGDKALNILIAKSLKEDGLITIIDLDNDNMLVTITSEGKAFISRGGYSIEAKRDRRKKIYKISWRIVKVLTTAVFLKILVEVLIHRLKIKGYL